MSYIAGTGLYDGFDDILKIQNSIIKIETTTEELNELIEINSNDINEEPEGIQSRLTATINKTNDIHTDICNVNTGIIKKLNDVEITANDVYDEVNDEVDGVLKII